MERRPGDHGIRLRLFPLQLDRPKSCRRSPDQFRGSWRSWSGYFTPPLIAFALSLGNTLTRALWHHLTLDLTNRTHDCQHEPTGRCGRAQGQNQLPERTLLCGIVVTILAEAAPLHFLGECLQAIRRVPGARPISGMIIRILAQFGGELPTLPRRHA
jgi:hypothetical protein